MSLPLLQSVQDQINDKAAYPLTGLAVAPDLVGISLSTTVEFKAGTSVDEKNLALSSAAAAAENYVNNLAVGQTLVVNEIADRIRNADPRSWTWGKSTATYTMFARWAAKTKEAKSVN